jgi:RNA polymerase sigma-70 factor (ECF subfamily)
MTSDGDVLAESMGEVVRNTTSQLTAADLERDDRLPAQSAGVAGRAQIAWNSGVAVLFIPMNEAERLVELIPRLRRYARALVGDRATADDLVQDTLERAWAKLHLYRRGTDLRAWLFTVMHNVHVNRVRATRPPTARDEMPELAQRASQGDALLVRDLDRAIARLPAEQRAVLLLVTLEEMSYEKWRARSAFRSARSCRACPARARSCAR